MVVRRQIQYGDDNRPMEVLMESNHLAVLLSADTLQPGGGFLCVSSKDSADPDDSYLPTSAEQSDLKHEGLQKFPLSYK